MFGLRKKFHSMIWFFIKRLGSMGPVQPLVTAAHVFGIISTKGGGNKKRLLIEIISFERKQEKGHFKK